MFRSGLDAMSFLEKVARLGSPRKPGVADAKLFLLFAAERSGTHLFRSILTKNVAAHAPGEVANAAATDESAAQTNFFRFRRDYLSHHADQYVPTQDNTRRLCDAFFDAFCASAARRGHVATVCDIKYGHVINFCGGWWDMMSPPLLLDWARQRRVGIVHLVRTRVAETCLSNLYAHHTGVWRTKDPASLKVSPMRVDRKRLEDDILRLQRVIAMFRNWVRPLDSIEIRYEDLLDGNSSSWERTRAFIDHSVPSIESDFLKTTPGYDQIIENFSDIRDLVAGSDLQDRSVLP